MVRLKQVPQIHVSDPNYFGIYLICVQGAV